MAAHAVPGQALVDRRRHQRSLRLLARLQQRALPPRPLMSGLSLLLAAASCAGDARRAIGSAPADQAVEGIAGDRLDPGFRRIVAILSPPPRRGNGKLCLVLRSAVT